MSFLPHKKFTWADFLGGFKYRYTPRRYAAEFGDSHFGILCMTGKKQTLFLKQLCSWK